MKKTVLLLALFVFCTLGAFAQGGTKTALGWKATIQTNTIDIQFYGPSMVRVVKYPAGKTFVKESLSVVKKPQVVKLKAAQQGSVVTLKSESLQVNLDLNTGKVSFSTPKGTALLTEKEGSARFVEFNDAGSKTYSVNQSYVLDKDEAIYGLGQQQQGRMVQRNLKLRMVQGNTDDYVPFFLSAKGYGLYWDNYSPTTFSDNSEETTFNSQVGDGIDYYFMLGGNADGVIAQMRDLTGQAPMIPLWTYGFWQSKERYKSQDELVGVVKKYRELGVPLDGIIQDWQYWGNNYLWNAMAFLNSDFSNPKKMVDDVHGMNAHLIISIWASFGPQTLQFREMQPKGMLMDFSTWPQSGLDVWPPDRNYPSGVKVYDAFNPEARDIYWKYLNKGLFSLGIDGWWMDSTDPDHLDFKDSDFDNKTYLGSFRKVRNAFPLMTVGGVADHQRATSSEKRVFILTRSAFAGQQRYGANTWSGDVTASWDALRNQISAGLNFSLCGMPNWNSDIGGFFLSRFRKKLQDPEYCELYTRWLEFGTFCPMMRSHGTDAPREIYNFGKKGTPVYDAIAKYINLRYSLLPYIYATSWEVTAKQSTMMRALVMDFAKDKDALNINDEYMFGSSFLVCPVTSMNKERSIYLPKGADWYDYWTNEKQAGGQTITKSCPLDVMPLYVKAGSIVPFGPAVQYATEKKWDDLEVRVYPGANGSFTLYEDENDNYNYEKGQYALIAFNWDNAKNVLTIANRKGSFPGMLQQRTFRITLPGKAAKVVTYVGKNMQVSIK